MTILTGKDIFSSKYITAEITDASNQLHYVPIEHTLGDYFLTDIDGKMYCFKIEGRRIKTWRRHKKIAKSFRVLQYDTNHYMPVSAEDLRELELVLKENGLPRVNANLWKVLKLLARKEDPNKQFIEHDLRVLMDEVSEHATRYPEEAKVLIKFLEDLGPKQIVTPVKKVSEFLEDDLITTDPGFLGDVISHFQRTDIEHKKISNTPVSAKGHWLKVIAVVMVIGLIGGIIVMLWQQGYFEGFSLPGLPSLGGQENTPEYWTNRYSTPEALKADIDAGRIDYNDLPPEIKRMVDSIG